MSLFVTFFVLQIFGGHFGITLLLATIFLSKNIRRNPLSINFLACWFLYTSSFCLLLYSGHLFSSEKPFALCLLQAATIYAVTVVTPLAGLTLVINVGLKEPANVGISQEGLYCVIYSPIMVLVPILAGLSTAGIVLFEGLIACTLYRRKHSSSTTKDSSSTSLTSLSSMIRIGISTAFALLAVITGVAFWLGVESGWSYIIQASLPTVAFIIFGTQKDMLAAWGVVRLWNRLIGKDDSDIYTDKPPPVPPKWTGTFYPFGLDRHFDRVSTGLAACSPTSPNFDKSLPNPPQSA
ncbi:hypothetical protein M0805_005676 [Coniferiporia weirii]|nr:hypothetical protein M0805_005676 [Coniferiporia weirii]